VLVLDEFCRLGRGFVILVVEDNSEKERSLLLFLRFRLRVLHAHSAIAGFSTSLGNADVWMLFIAALAQRI